MNALIVLFALLFGWLLLSLVIAGLLAGKGATDEEVRSLCASVFMAPPLFAILALHWLQGKVEQILIPRRR